MKQDSGRVFHLSSKTDLLMTATEMGLLKGIGSALGWDLDESSFRSSSIHEKQR